MVCDINSPMEDAPKLLTFPVALEAKDLRKRMDIQRRIILVRKTWYRIYMPCLLEEITILDSKGPNATVNILNKYTIGHIAKRLDLFLWKSADKYPIARLDMDSVWDNLDSLLPPILALPNLQVLDVDRYLGPTRAPTDTTVQTIAFPACIDFITPFLTVTQLYLGTSFGLLPDNTFSFQSVTSLLFGIHNLSWTNRSKMLADRHLIPCVKYVGIQTASVAKFNNSLVESPINDSMALYLPPSVHTLGLSFHQPKAKTRIPTLV
ncbi:hypothetical protein BDP27DRAFT_337627 [Rhodocollybia butyracea]|uniref:Uncharacterized protein n=1 Tax=Rhodocollybia butyracea TaxID=206335 RepID=A0A9P5QCA4_9AGAR|nr:hypothetical protein BDP27DRAFT_337627 [Rhodocollybia butyracea]